MRSSAAMVLLLLLIAVSAPAVEAGARGVISCTPADIDMMPANWNIDDGACVRVDLGILSPGDTLSFDVESDAAVDILLFAASSISVYQNEQNYRHDSVWQGESVFESFTGAGQWHWTAPSDRGDTRWYLVIDNMAHPQDQGNGAQGGSLASVTLDSQTITSPTFGIVDTIVRLDVGEHAVLAGPLTLDAGTQVDLFATTMEGHPDVFLMTQAQLDLYEVGGTAAARIGETDMLLISTERNLVWSVTEEYEGTDLYLVVDNRAGPSGGGAGTSIVATTVVMDLTPVLEPVISDAENLATVDVGASVMLDASETPNRSDQIPSTGFHWDTNGDGIDDTVGLTVNVSWTQPTNVTIRLRVIAEDGRSDSVYLEIEVSDISPPEADIGASETIRRDFDDDLVLSAAFSDNWGIASVEWLVDGMLIDSYDSSNFDDGRSFTFRFDATYSAGEHIVTLRVTDEQGQVSEDTAIIELYDSTPPIVASATEEITVVLGTSYRFDPEVIDPESVSLDYSWDFDIETDGDGDGDPTNDVDASGDQVIHEFLSKGTFRVICTITNDAGVSTQIEYFVSVVGTSDDNPLGLDPLVLVAGAVLLTLIIVALVGMVGWRRMSNARLETLLAEQAVAEAEKPRELSLEEQKAMYGGGTSVTEPSTETANSPFGQYATGMSATGDPHAAEISPAAAIDDPDLEALVGSSVPIQANSPSSPAADLLAEFAADEVAIARDEVDFSHDEEAPIAGQVWSHEEASDSASEESLPTPPPPAPDTAEIALPSPPPPSPAETESSLADETPAEAEADAESTLPSPPVPAGEEEVPTAPEPAAEPAVEQAAEPAVEQAPSAPVDRTVQQDCSQCSQRFEVTLPEGHDVARTACPGCGSIETISLT